MIKEEKKELGRSWYYLTQRKKRHLKFTTIIIGAIRTNVAEISDMTRRAAIIKQAASMMNQFRDDWILLGKSRRLVDYTYRGQFEIDMRREITEGSHCYETLKSMGCDVSPLAHRERILVVHIHFVLEASSVALVYDVSGELWASKVRKVLKTAWPGVRRTQVKGLRDNQSVDTAIRNIYGYCTKRVYRYAEGGYGDVTTSYTDTYEWIWRCVIFYAYKGVRGGISFRSKR